MNFFDKIVSVLLDSLDIRNKDVPPVPKTARAVYTLLFLLLTPDLHNESVRQELCEKHLSSDLLAADRYVATALHIAKRAANDLLGGVVTVVISNGVVGYGTVEEIGLDPAGADCHDLDAELFQLDVQRT